MNPLLMETLVADRHAALRTSARTASLRRRARTTAQTTNGTAALGNTPPQAGHRGAGSAACTTC